MNEIISVTCFTEAMFGENAFVVAAKGHGGVWVIDPSFEPQARQIRAHVADQGKVVEAVILTHGHVDHIAGVDVVLAGLPEARLWIAAEDAEMLGDPQANLSAPFGMAVCVEARPTDLLDAGTVLTLGPTQWVALDTSGHSPGGRSLYCAEAGIVFTGDALFAGSIGRTDFPGSEHSRLIENIRTELLSLPGDTQVLSGHGPATTVQKERMSNPFVAE
ncbi:MAG: MBL fold metallo-hydrolase [Phycisphaerae bacterium]|nr:MBL fold metallo-hydrolase [Phycisphaerae bacterium]